jgi:hypothetical protein
MWCCVRACSLQLVAAAGYLLFFPSSLFPQPNSWLAQVCRSVVAYHRHVAHTLVGVMMIGYSVFVINTCATLASWKALPCGAPRGRHETEETPLDTVLYSALATRVVASGTRVAEKRAAGCDV